MAKKKPEKTFDQAWQINLEEAKPIRKLECPTCGRKTIYRMNPKDKTPFCVKCLDKTLEKLGLKRMIDKGSAGKVVEQIMTWSPSAAAVGKVVVKKARK